MMDTRDIAALLDIALRAIDAETAAAERKEHQQMLSSAYEYHKRQSGLDHVEVGSTEWDAMMAATKIEYADAEKAKRAEYNAKRRLQTSIRRYRAKAYA